MEPAQFQSAKHKLIRTNHHINELNQLLIDFFKTQAFFTVTSEKVGDHHVLKVETGGNPIPPAVPLILGDTVHNIRTAFDHAIASFTGTKYKLSLPTGKTRENIINCSSHYKIIEKEFPKLAEYILDKLQPFEKGHLSLWEISQLDNWDKHNLLIPTLSISKVENISARDENNNSMSGITVVLDHGKTINLIAFNSPATVLDKGIAHTTLIFKEPVLEGHMIMPTLKECVHSSFKALNALELFCYGKVTLHENIIIKLPPIVPALDQMLDLVVKTIKIMRKAVASP